MKPRSHRERLLLSSLLLLTCLFVLTVHQREWALSTEVRLRMSSSAAPAAVQDSTEAPLSGAGLGWQSAYSGSVLPDMEATRGRKRPASAPVGSQTEMLRKAMVMRRTAWENVTWVEDQFPDWERWIYSSDQELQDVALPLQVDKGNEANAYLTFIIENYENLPDVALFLHAHENVDTGGWHIDNDDQSNAWSVRNLRLANVLQHGYANLRCLSDPGCPVAFQNPPRADDEYHYVYDTAFIRAWPALFPGISVPQYIASPCCAQFAVSKAQILQRSRAEYVRIWLWLMETPDDDRLSGTVLEYLWAYIFGRQPEHCPDVWQCWCDTYEEFCYELEDI